MVRLLTSIRILGLRRFIDAKLRGERAKVAVARLKSQQQSVDLAEYDKFLLVRETSTEQSLAPYWGVSSRYLHMIHDLLVERDIPLLLGFCPYGMLVGPDQWGDGRQFWGFERGRTYEAPAALALLSRFAKDESMPFINALETFRASGRTETLFYPEDGHFTPAGHRALARHVVHDPAFLRVLQNRLHRAPRAASPAEIWRRP